MDEATRRAVEGCVAEHWLVEKVHCAVTCERADEVADRLRAEGWDVAVVPARPTSVIAARRRAPR